MEGNLNPTMPYISGTLFGLYFATNLNGYMCLKILNKYAKIS